MAKRQALRKAALPPVATLHGSDPRACPACGGAAFELLFEASDRLYLTTPHRFQIVECAKCGVIRLYPRPTPAELARYTRAPVEPVRRTLAGRLESICRDALVFDEARFALAALEHTGLEGPVLDASLDGIPFRRALVARGIKVFEAPNGQLDAVRPRPGGFAVISLFGMLERAEDPAACLEQARSLLADTGRLIIQSPNAACWQFLMFGENWNEMDVPRRMLHFRSRDLELLLDYCGFEVTRRKHFCWRKNPAGFAISLAPGLSPSVRRARCNSEGRLSSLLRSFAYLALVGVAVPFTAVEAACRAGSTITLEARKKP